jgi:hypothetical protein
MILDCIGDKQHTHFEAEWESLVYASCSRSDKLCNERLVAGLRAN